MVKISNDSFKVGVFVNGFLLMATPKRQVKVIQPIEAGSVTAIHVTEGQKVKKGLLLIELDPAITQAESNRLKNEINELDVQLNRNKALLSLVKNKQTFATINTSSLTPEHLTLLQNEFAQYQQQQSKLANELERLTAELLATELRETQIKTTLPLLQERATSLETLQKNKLVSRDQFLAIKQEALELEHEMLIQTANVKQLNVAIKGAEQQLTLLKQELITTTQGQVTEALRQKNALHQELIKSEFLQQKTKLLAPTAGTVENLMITTIGAVVTPAQELMQIVPKDSELIVEAGLLNKDIGFTYTGQSVEVKIESFPFTRYGVIEGEVIDVSTDTIEHEQLGLIFPIKVALQAQTINVDGRTVPLSAGMIVSAEVKTGKRRIIEFLLSPIVQHMDEGIRER
ncbi:HlyD family type I secretion periplasmic adaptor subunit [Pseudoalteromonas sp. P1-9]|uniref:HlyD family type I secretion periplasmic adaptor subunit n=1 Tax=Pseudoalteromonas sp. P1-9 TaxID=1710354 RepID=UPI0019106379|nr:HlyD family type I secretion periplasmic adaptor subunit [Pseudoalteromonas sp. P1-9]